MARMLNLRGAVFELVVDTFDNGATAQQKTVGVEQELVFHVLAQLGNQLQGVLGDELVKQRLRQTAFGSEEFAEQSAGQARHGRSVIDIAWRLFK